MYCNRTLEYRSIRRQYLCWLPSPIFDSTCSISIGVLRLHENSSRAYGCCLWLHQFNPSLGIFVEVGCAVKREIQDQALLLLANVANLTSSEHVTGKGHHRERYPRTNLRSNQIFSQAL